MSASLTVSVVTYAPRPPVVEETLRTLAASLAHAREAGSLGGAEVTLVDNGPGDSAAAKLGELLDREIAAPVGKKLLTGHGNVGYGRGNNLALLASRADFHLVLNPDVSIAREAVDEALRYMAANPGAVILAPEVRDSEGGPIYLCKRYPSVLDLALRGFAPSGVQGWFKGRLERYEMRDLPRDRPSTGVPLLSGSFMFCRRAPIAALGGFDERYFLYFEDFDLCLRAAKVGELAWVPAVKIVHHGGYAARKGWAHVRLFAASAVRFFNRHGWKLA
jgi:GT2 family glycosyltransferase